MSRPRAPRENDRDRDRRRNLNWDSQDTAEDFSNRAESDPLLALIGDVFTALRNQIKLYELHRGELSLLDKKSIVALIATTAIMFDTLITKFEIANKGIISQNDEADLKTLVAAKHSLCASNARIMDTDGKELEREKLIKAEQERQHAQGRVVYLQPDPVVITPDDLGEQLEEQTRIIDELQIRIDNLEKQKQRVEEKSDDDLRLRRSSSEHKSVYDSGASSERGSSSSSSDEESDPVSRRVSATPSSRGRSGSESSVLENKPENLSVLARPEKKGFPWLKLLGFSLLCAALGVATVFTLGATGVIGIGIVGAVTASSVMTAGGGGFAAIGTAIGAATGIAGSTAALAGLGAAVVSIGSALIPTLLVGFKKLVINPAKYIFSALFSSSVKPEENPVRRERLGKRIVEGHHTLRTA